MKPALSVKIKIPEKHVMSWYYHTVANLGGNPVTATLGPSVTAEAISLKTVAKAPSGGFIHLGITIRVGRTVQHVRVVADEIARPQSPRPILPRPERVAYLGAIAEVDFGLPEEETDEQQVSAVLTRVIAQFQASAARVMGEPGEFTLGIILGVDANWPEGKFSFASYTCGRVYEGDGFRGSLALLARSVPGFSGDECKVTWHHTLNVTAVALGIVTSRTVSPITDGVPAKVRDILDFPFYPMIENVADSRQMALLDSLAPAAIASPWDPPRSTGFVNFIPDDLNQIFTAIEKLPPKRRQILDDAVMAFHVATTLQEKTPTLGLTAYWTVLERLADWYRIRKSLILNCGCRKSRTVDAIHELMVRVGHPISAEQESDVRRILAHTSRNVRNPWTHAGELAGRDFAIRPQVWTIGAKKTPPTWATTSDVLYQLEDFARIALEAVILSAARGE